MAAYHLLFFLVVASTTEEFPECAKPDFWKRISSPACAVLFEEEACTGDSKELFVPSGENGTARSASIRPGCSLYEGDKDIGEAYRRPFGLGEAPRQYWTSDANRSHEVHCRCFTNNTDALTCKPSEEWILIATHDNRKYSVASLFEYKYTREYLVGPNGMIVMSPWHAQRNQRFLDHLTFHGLQTSNVWYQRDYSVDKIPVPAKSCAFILQKAYKCGSFFYVRSNVEVRVQDSSSTNGGTQPCNLDNASAVSREK